MPKNNNLSGDLFTKKALTIRETPLSASIAEWLDLKGIYNDRLNSGKIKTVKSMWNGSRWVEGKPYWIHLCKAGTPDRFAIVNGRIVFIEVKQLGKKPSPEQLAKHDELRRSGAIVLVVDSFDDFEKKFKAICDNISC